MLVPQSVFDAYYATVDSFTNDDFGIACTVIYPAKKTVCPNCIYDSLNKRSSGVYKAGGPISFTVGPCPFCAALGYTSVQDTDSIKLRCYFNPKYWVKFPGVEINAPNTMAQIYGHIIDLPKINRADYMRLATNELGYASYDFILAGEPRLHGFRKNKYFIAMLGRK